ncbi:MAG TPA: YciI family protein [Phenylobacterium sp.]
MRFLLIVKATPESESGQMPADVERLFADMGRFNEEMIAAGVMVDGAGLQPSAAGTRVRFEGLGKPVVTRGPFPNTTELASGYWILECPSNEDAVGWAKRVPFSSGEVELRPLIDPEAFEGLVSDDEIQKEHEHRAEQLSKAPKPA